MSNQEHLELLQQGAEIWNQWRKEHPEIQLDFSEVNLESVDLRAADLSRVGFRRAFLYRTILDEANLTEANLQGADLHSASLIKANLYRAALHRAYLHGANLDEANLTGADLVLADLSDTSLNGTDLSQTTMWSTRFGDVDLSKVKGLDTVHYEGPLTIGIDTILRSGGNIPESFLKGAGIPDTFIAQIRSLIEKPYYKCFISYSSKDQTFVEQLYADLQSNGVRCWYASEDMKIGDKIRPRIEEAIRMHDKLLLVLSEYSIASNWVAYEVERALNKEPEGIPNVLFPIRLDDAVMNSKAGWAEDIRRTRHIGNFTSWKSHHNYQKALSRLLRDLKSESVDRP
jgi:hypothetical protein